MCLSTSMMPQHNVVSPSKRQTPPAYLRRAHAGSRVESGDYPGQRRICDAENGRTKSIGRRKGGKDQTLCIYGVSNRNPAVRPKPNPLHVPGEVGDCDTDVATEARALRPRVRKADRVRASRSNDRTGMCGLDR